MTQTILITGATGAVGMALANEFSTLDAQVRLGTRSPDKLNNKLSNNSHAVYLDLDCDKSIMTALKGVDKVFFITPSLLKSNKNWDEAAMAKRFIDLASASGVKHIVRLSAMNAHLFKESTHYKIEGQIKASGMNWTILRPSFFMQIFDMYYLPSIKNKCVIDYYDADVKEAFIDARDIAAVATKALMEEGHHAKIYTLTSDELLNYKDIAKIFSHTLNEKITYTAQNDNDSLKALVHNQWPKESAKSYVGILQAVQAGVFSELSEDVSTVLGRKPIGFSRYAQDYKARFI